MEYTGRSGGYRKKMSDQELVIITLSKCGPAGVYRACLADIYIVYGENYEVYRQ